MFERGGHDSRVEKEKEKASVSQQGQPTLEGTSHSPEVVDASPIEVPPELVALVVDVDVERAEPVGRAMELLLAQHRREELQQRVPVVEGV